MERRLVLRQLRIRHADPGDSTMHGANLLVPRLFLGLVVRRRHRGSQGSDNKAEEQPWN